MAQRRLKYSEFVDRIDVDAFEEAIGWTPEYTVDNNDVGFCVFPENHSHGDTTGKFAIERELRVYNCWACGGGSLLSLAMELNDMGVSDATDWLYQFTLDGQDDEGFLEDFLASFDDAKERIETLPYFNKRVLEKFNEPIPEWWLEEKCIFPEYADLYGVRYSSKATRRAPEVGKYADDDDYEGPAIIFPHIWSERLVGWQTRWLDEDRPDWVPKYTMTTDFPKENTLYGWDKIEWHRNHGGGIMVVESVPSVLFLESMGQACVATFGSSVNEAQLRLLRRCPTIILAPDNDPAGTKWTHNLAEYLKRFSKVLVLPPYGDEPGADVGDIASADDPDTELYEYLAKAEEYGVQI